MNSPWKRPYGPWDESLSAFLPSGMSVTGSHLAVSVKTFGALPFARMILTSQNPGLRKHPGVGLDDL